MILKRDKFLIFSFLFVLNSFLFLGLFQVEINLKDYNSLNEKTPNSSGFWNLSPFVIDDLGFGDYTWSQAASQPWCRGSGTWSDPYIIENVTIDGGNSGNCLEIWNSIVYYIIRNVTLYNSGSGTWDAGISLNNVDNGKISNSNFSNNRYGVYISSSDNNTFSSNYISNNIQNGIYILNSNNNSIQENEIYNNNNGVLLDNSLNNSITRNSAEYNFNSGLYSRYSDLNTYSKNNFSNNYGHGFYIRDFSDNNSIKDNIVCNNSRGLFFSVESNFNIITRNNISFNRWEGIFLYLDSHSNNISKNNVTHNLSDGIKVSTNKNYISGNNASNNDNGIILDSNCRSNKVVGNLATGNSIGIYLWPSHNNSILSNNAHLNTLSGIRLSQSENNTISGNNASENSQEGIAISSSNNNLILGNNLENNSMEGISLLSSNNNSITNNSLNYNTIYGVLLSLNSNNNTISGNNVSYVSSGISLDLSNNNSITENNLSYNNLYGLYISGSDSNSLQGNTLNSNMNSGLYLTQSDNNIVFDNTIFNNTNYGVYLTGSGSICENNLFYINNFTANGENARDDGQNNYWNNTIVGNYWDDYYNFDNNYDGIGDVPYNISGTFGSKDFLPISFLHNFHLLIDSPLNNTLLASPPFVSVRAMAINISYIWYNISGNPTKFFLENNTAELLNVTQWNDLPEGKFQISFYLNDTVGQINKTTYSFYKDSIKPNITLNFPKGGLSFNSTAPTYNIEVFDVNLDEMWYSLNNIKNITFTANGTIDQSNWTALSDGTIILTFYANDYTGKISYTQIVLIKDVKKPIINLKSPKEGEIFTKTPPNINIEIIEENLDTILLSINGGKNMTFISNGRLEKSLWDALPDGVVILSFYVNDTAGNFEILTIEIAKSSPQSAKNGAEEIPPIFIVIIFTLLCASVIAPIVLVKRSRIKLREKEIEIESMRQQKEQITENDIVLSKEKHICLVHKGPIEGFNFICRECGAFYCRKCVDALKELENECWACGKPLDPTIPVKSISEEDEVKTIIDDDELRFKKSKD